MGRWNEADYNEAMASIEWMVREKGYAPSRRELARLIGNTSSACGEKMFRRLAEKGLIELDPRVSRGVRITAAGMAAVTETM